MIIPLMNRIVTLYWSVVFLSCMCNLEDALSKKPNLVHSKCKGKYTSDITNYEIVVPQRVNKDGNFISHLISHHHSKRSAKELDFIFYKIPIGGIDYLIELTPNRQLISPGAIIEIHKEDAKKSDVRKCLNESSNNETIGKMFRNLDVQKLENTECHFSGRVKGENISKAALSTCYGLAGFIQIKKGLYTIEPVAEHNPFIEDAYPHILYKTDGLENSSVCHTIGELTVSLVDQIIRKRRESNTGLSLPIFIETLIVMDKTLINHHQDSDCENYVLTVFNMAFNLFQDASSGLMMTLTIVRIIRLEVENDEMNLRVNADAEKTLRYFQTWQYEINAGDDSHPNHHDIAVLITRVNVCYSPSSCGLLGLTTIGKACDPKLSAALCEDTGLRLGYVIAHEIGHLLGADHDFENSTCNGTDVDGLKTVMHPHVSLTAQTWSACSQAYFKAFFSSGMGNCLLDEPEEHHFNVQDLLPGVMYNADFQCKHFITMNARECDMGSTCDSLNCYVPGYACIITHTPPVDGTHCGENMWCHDAKCLVVGERPGAVDGNWGEWSAWSDCSRTCGSGVTSATRSCDKPQPSHGGKACFGERKRYKICSATPCETGRPSFRDIQCGEFDDWIYPEDGKVHTWKAYFFHDDNPCILYCINEKKQVAALRPRVVDGTMCFRGIRDICIAGTCKTLPCDLHFESNAVEDACGVCHGDGTGCEFSEGTETFSKLPKGLTKLLTVPTGTRNIKVEVISPLLARIIVRDKDTKDVYIRGKSLGMFNVPGSQAWLGVIKKNQEALNIPGPVTKPLSILIQRLDNATVKWSMALPAEQQRKPEFAWDFLKWGPCSAKCGPGTQKSKPSCMEEKAGLVEDSFCADLEMPPTKVRQCEVAKCESRWMVGDWKGCEQPNSSKKERKRVVYCIKPIGEGEGETQIVSDSECLNPKPHESEPCENRQKREDTEYNVDGRFFEPYSRFTSDASEFSFHEKYKDYLKHLAELSVPERNSETSPFYFAYSSKFKHYFHGPEVPEHPETGLNSDADVNLSNEISSVAQSKNQASPDFYKVIFNDQKIGISHMQSVFQQARASKNMTEKSPESDYLRSQNGNSEVKFNLSLKSIYQRSRRRQNERTVGKYSNLCSDVRPKSRMRLRKNHEKETRNIKEKCFGRKKHKKNFNYTSPNLTSVIKKLQENEQSRFVKLLNKNGPRKYFSLERTKLNSHELNAHHTNDLHHKVHHKLSSFFSFSSKKNSNEKCRSTADKTELKLMKPNPREFDGSGIRRLSSAKEDFQEKVKNYDIQKLIKADKTFYANPFSPVCNGKFDLHAKKSFKDKHLTLETYFSEKRNKRYRIKEMNSKSKRITKSCLYQQKRSNRIWKKPKPKDPNPKSGKEQSGAICGTETRNYLNNLFRDNHPKIFTAKPTQTNKPQELKVQCKKPVIREGALVLDKDLPENQEMEILFENEEGERRKNYLKLPQPVLNEKKLTLKGQDVFNLLKKLQEVFYRTKTHYGKNIEINVPKSKTETSENGKNSCEKISTTEITTTIKKVESTVENPKFSESTVRSYNTTTTISPAQSTTTASESRTTGNSKSEDDSDECDYDIDMSPDDPDSAAESTTKDKKKKNKIKNKKKKTKIF